MKKVFMYIICISIFLSGIIIPNEKVYAADIYKLSYNENNISAIGKQGKNQCMAYALAYCRTILDGYTHAGTEYWQTGVGGMYGKANYTTAGATTKQALLRIVYDQINAGLPVCMYVTGKYRQNRNYTASGDHWVTVVGYKRTANPDALNISDFYILDPGNCGYDFLYDDDKCIKCTSTSLRISKSGTTTVSPYSRVYVDTISDTNAKIHAELTSTRYLSTIGFYISKNFDMSGSSKITEKINANVLTIWYDMNKWYGVLEKGTTYYYQFYIVYNGTEIKSDIQSFDTTGDGEKPTISNVKISDVTNEGYTVSCTITDNVGVTRVYFPTWTDANGQDDLAASWPSVAAPSANNTYTFRVKVSDHKNEGGLYHTHIYAYDAAGNYAKYETSATVVLEVPLTGFKLSTSSLNIGKQEIVQLGVTSYSPSNTTSAKKATWKSENTSIATVDANGQVTGVKAGTTNIVCTIDGIQKKCAVTVADVEVGEWSGWATSLSSTITGNPQQYEVQQKTQYRSRTKSTTTSTSSSLSGWTKYGEYWGDWKSSSTSVTATADREVKKVDTFVKTQYNYSHWHNYNSKITSPIEYSGYVYEETGWLDAPLTNYGTSSLGVPMYKGSSGMGPCSWATNWYNQTTRDVYNTTYQYRDKIYQYYQWSSWSGWSDTAKTASDTVEVEKRTVYRYREIVHPLSATIKLQNVTSGNITEDDVVTVVGSATGGKGSYKHKFAYTHNGETIIEQDYAANSTWNWEPCDGGDFILTVWVKDEQGTVATQTLNVNVKQVYHISLDVSQIDNLQVGQVRTFTAYVDGVKVENSSLAWTSSNPEVATCFGGELIGVSAGTTTISCTKENGTVATCKVTVVEKLAITSQPVSQSVIEGNDAVFTVTATGNKLSYQWQVRTSSAATWSNSGMTGSNTNSITVQGTNARNGYQYRCVITDGNSNKVTSNVATLTVLEKLAITGQPVSQSVTEEASATFKVTATGSKLGYQWQFRTSAAGEWKNSGMTGSNTNSITVQGTNARNGYQYRCVITDGSGNKVTSNGATLTVAPKLAITSQPTSQSVAEGASATFKVTATGSKLSYQWQVKTAGATKWTDSGMTGSKTNSITVQGTTTRNGYQYRCVITDGSGNTLTSNGATLTVAPKLAITGQPTSQSVEEGTSATFKVTATGSKISYQWQFRTSSTGTWANSGMTGSNTNSITVQGTNARNGYQYRCVITDGSGNTVTSNAATLTVAPKLAITGQPKSQSVTEGDNATFKVTATGSKLSYQWQFRTSSTGTWTNSGMTGANTNSITVQGTTARNGYQYRCVITDGLGNKVTSNGATLTVTPKLAITGQPKSQSVTEGGNATFKVTATGSKLSYQWQFRTSSTDTWTNSGMTGAKTNSITVQGTTARNGYQYRCIITDGTGNKVTSNGATLTVTPKLAITGQPKSQSVPEGVSATFKVTATGSKLSYQWQFRTSSTGTWTNSGMTGANTNSIKVQGTTARNGYQYRCIITDGTGNKVTSNAVTLTVWVELDLTSQPTNQSVTEGGNATFKVTATGTKLSYQWQFRTSAAGEWKNSGMAEANTNSITVQGTTARNGYQYRCVITDIGGNKVTSNGATLTVTPKLAITGQPKSQSVTEGDNATFKVTATGSKLSYQWQFRTSASGTWKNSGMTGANTNSITVQGTTARNGYQYRCIITDGSGNKVTSNGATLTVK